MGFYQTQQSKQSDYNLEEITVKQSSFIKNTDVKSLKKYAKPNPKKFTRKMSIDVNEVSFLGRSHHLNEITDKLAEKLKYNEDEIKKEESTNKVKTINDYLQI